MITMNKLTVKSKIICINFYFSVMRIAEKFGLVLMKLLRIDPETLNIVAATTLHSYQIVILLHSLVSLVAFCQKF